MIWHDALYSSIARDGLMFCVLGSCTQSFVASFCRYVSWYIPLREASRKGEYDFSFRLLELALQFENPFSPLSTCAVAHAQ